jgi:hypothetical protein
MQSKSGIRQGSILKSFNAAFPSRKCLFEHVMTAKNTLLWSEVPHFREGPLIKAFFREHCRINRTGLTLSTVKNYNKGEGGIKKPVQI